MLSRRVQKFLAGAPPIVEAHFRTKTDPYGPANPQGYINLGTAENHLLWDFLEPKLNSDFQVSEETIHYGLLHGSAELRHAFARLLERGSKGKSISPENIVVASGCSAILDMMFYALCEEGEAVLIPSPYYGGFAHDAEAKAHVEPISVPLSSATDFELSLADLKQALTEARAKGKSVRALVLCSPQNPLGKLLSRELIQSIIDWSIREKIHLISDEIYAHSVYGDQPFISALELTEPSPYVHIAYGMAKDFGLSGFKVGVMHSWNPELVRVMRELCYFAPVSGHTQALLAHILSDEAWVSSLFEANRTALRQAHKSLSDALATHGIRHNPSNAGIFVWLDLRSYLSSPTVEAEAALWQRIFNEAKVNISPGSIFRSPEPGWFRLCFATHSSHLVEAVQRIARVLKPGAT